MENVKNSAEVKSNSGVWLSETKLDSNQDHIFWDCMIIEWEWDENTKLQMWILIPVKYKLLWFKLRFWFQWLLSVYYSYLKPEISWNYLWLAMRHVGLVSLLHHTRILPDCIKILQSCYYTSGFKNFLLQAKTPAIKFYQCCIMETFSFQIFTVLTILWLESRIWRKKELLKNLNDTKQMRRWNGV